ncbi:hypothetical protein GGR52DRAFT_121706 [Hypoxylon sp. FL1284]|nr:hypothetical protein GGR52DRAFT_121706 [Hypoxylon sp. FL1284]
MHACLYQFAWSVTANAEVWCRDYERDQNAWMNNFLFFFSFLTTSVRLIHIYPAYVDSRLVPTTRNVKTYVLNSPTMIYKSLSGLYRLDRQTIR